MSTSRRNLLQLAGAGCALALMGEALDAAGTLRRYQVSDTVALPRFAAGDLVVADTALTRFAGDGLYLYPAWGTPRLGFGYDHGSGDSNPNDDEVETFENLFGTQHRPYGLMDLTGARNMHIPKLTFSVKPVEGLTLNADFLAFWLDDTSDFFYPESGGGRAGNGYGINPGASSFVGTELDLYANYKVTSWANFQLGYGHFFVGDHVKDSVAATTDADWLYTQVMLTF